MIADQTEALTKAQNADLKEDKDYYTKLKAMEKKSDEEKGPFTPVDAGRTRGWLKSLGTSPEDAQVHDYAEEQGYNVHQLESVIYNLAHQHVTEK
jgi:geranylgeranyl pyrophosphate synthase